MMDRDNITRTGARAPGVWRCSSKGLAPTLSGENQHILPSTKSGSKPHPGNKCPVGRPRLIGQPWSRTGENPPYGILGGTMETSASFEARSAPSSYPTAHLRKEEKQRAFHSVAADDTQTASQAERGESRA